MSSPLVASQKQNGAQFVPTVSYDSATWATVTVTHQDTTAVHAICRPCRGVGSVEMTGEPVNMTDAQTLFSTTMCPNCEDEPRRIIRPRSGTLAEHCDLCGRPSSYAQPFIRFMPSPNSQEPVPMCTACLAKCCMAESQRMARLESQIKQQFDEVVKLVKHAGPPREKSENLIF